MERATQKDERGYYLVGDGIYSDEGGFRPKIGQAKSGAGEAKIRRSKRGHLHSLHGRPMSRRELLLVARPGGGVTMKRLTSKGFRLGKDNSDLLPSYESIYHRLFAIEDIMGDEYDLDRLRELAQADKEGISPCTFCRFNPPSSGDGKPCCMCPAVAALRREQDG